MLEAELVDKIISYLNRHKIRNSKEIRMGVGVPDIVINIGASKLITQISDYYLLSLVEYINDNKKVSLQKATQHLSFDQAKCQNYINQLIKENIIYLKNDMLYPKRKIMDRNLGKAISIEAKLKDWKSGILQAQRYLMFSDYSYLALPEDKIKNVDLAELKEKGIGLLSVTEKGLDEIVKPIQSKECDYKQKYILTSSIIKDAYDIKKRKPDGVFSNL